MAGTRYNKRSGFIALNSMLTVKTKATIEIKTRDRNKFCVKENKYFLSALLLLSLLSDRKYLFSFTQNLLRSFVGVIIVAIILVATIISASNKLNPFEYTEFIYSGYNSNGTAYINFDKDTLIYDLIGDEPEELENMIVWNELYDQYCEAIEYECTADTGLSNNQEITVTFTVSDVLSNKVKSGSYSYTVTGLPEVETVDAFSGIRVIFDGVSGEAYAQVDKATDDEYVCYFSYSIDNAYHLSNGETVTVSITNAESVVEQNYIIPENLTKEYSVENLPEYVSSVEQIPKDKLNDIIDQFVKEESSGHTDEFSLSYGEAKYYGSYLLVQNDNASYSADMNRLEVFVCYDQYTQGTFWRTIYTPL